MLKFEMKLANIIKNRKSAIAKKWFTLVVETYPHDTAKFLKSQGDPFANPVGEATITGLTGIIDELAGDMNTDQIKSHLDAIIRIRAVQNFTASRAVGFVFYLKPIIRDIAPAEDLSPAEALTIDNRIDAISLAAFDIFMRCKEALYQLKNEEIRTRVYGAFERAGLVAELIPTGTENSRDESEESQPQ